MARGAGDVSLRDGIAVREQHRGNGAVGLDAHGIDRQHVRPVEEESDAAEALRLALGAIGAAGQIKSGERSVGLGIAEGDQLEGKGVRRNPGNRQRAVLELIVGGRERLAIERDAFERKTLAVEHERLAARRHFGVWTQPELGGDARRLGLERHVEVDLLDQIVGGAHSLSEVWAGGPAGPLGQHHPFAVALRGQRKECQVPSSQVRYPTGGLPGLVDQYGFVVFW